MSRALRRGAVALASVLLASGGLGLAATLEAAALPVAGACTDGAGITVVVDFGATGGGVQARCAPAPVADGFEALTKAGFTITNVSTQPGFLCRIDGEPADEPCNHVPSVSRYWSYWYASRGEPWTYSSSSASRKPPPGSVEGWSFGAGDPPGESPPGPVPTTTTPPPPPTAADGAPTTGATASTGAGSSAPTIPLGGAGSSTTVTAGVGEERQGDATSTSRAAGRSGSPGSDDEGEQAAPGLDASATPGDGDAGSPVGLLAAALVVGALGITGARTVRRRAAGEAEG